MDKELNDLAPSKQTAAKTVFETFKILKAAGGLGLSRQFSFFVCLSRWTIFSRQFLSADSSSLYCFASLGRQTRQKKLPLTTANNQGDELLTKKLVSLVYIYTATNLGLETALILAVKRYRQGYICPPYQHFVSNF